MLKKAVVIGVIGILIGMSILPSNGTLISEKPLTPAEQKARQSPLFWESVSLFGFQIGKHHELTLASPGINFPLPGEVFRAGDVVEINGTVSMPGFQNYTLKWGVGLAPTEWFTPGVTLVNNGTVEIINATLGFWDTELVTEAGYYTLLLTVHLVDSGQYMVNVSVYIDPTLRLNFPFGWPEEIQGTQVAIWSPIALSDINADGYQEIGFGTVTIGPVGGNNHDYVIDPMGNVLSGWPFQIITIQGASLTFADIDTATSNEEVIGGMWGDKIFVWHDDGTIMDGWPKSVYDARSSVAVNDVDGDGDLELILPSTDGGGKIYVVHHNGATVEGWPVSFGNPVRAAASTADIDQDGFPEILYGDQEGYVRVLYHDGSVADGWPQRTQDYIISSPVIADLEGDGDMEIITCSGFTQQRQITVWHHDGTVAAGWPQENGLAFAQPSVADIDNDGDLEILTGGAIANTTIGRFYVWHHDGTLANGWPLTIYPEGFAYLGFIYAQPVVGDIDGDADVEIIVGSYNRKFYAWHHDATSVTGWPKTIGDGVDSTAAIADIDNDGLVEVVVAGDDGKIYAWDMDGAYNASHMEWPLYQYDQHHTGFYTRNIGPNRPPKVPTITGPENAKIKVAVTYNFTTTDPNGNKVYYYIDWGDESNSGWVGPYPSGDVITQSHTWTKKGIYTIKAKAKDIHGNESDWGTEEITMPFSYVIPFQPFLQRLFERFIDIFPLLRVVLQGVGFFIAE